MSFGRRGGTAGYYGATITIINRSHLIIAAEYVGLARRVSCWHLFWVNRLDFEVQSIFVSFLAADLFSLVYLWEHNAQTTQHSNRHRLVVSLVN